MREYKRRMSPTIIYSTKGWKSPSFLEKKLLDVSYKVYDTSVISLPGFTGAVLRQIVKFLFAGCLQENEICPHFN